LIYVYPIKYNTVFFTFSLALSTKLRVLFIQNSPARHEHFKCDIRESMNYGDNLSDMDCIELRGQFFFAGWYLAAARYTNLPKAPPLDSGEHSALRFSRSAKAGKA
jgi:hypothetical protein